MVSFKKLLDMLVRLKIILLETSIISFFLSTKKVSFILSNFFIVSSIFTERAYSALYFSFIISCDEVGVGKNKPDIFYLAANKLNAKPSEIAVYEDADFALITAKEAGFYTIGVYDDYFKNARKDIELISDIYIESFKELL